jgi:hypothetical protein
VDEQKIGNGHYGIRRQGASYKTRGYQQSVFLIEWIELVISSCTLLESSIMVIRCHIIAPYNVVDVAFIVDFDDDITESLADDPFGGLPYSVYDSRFIFEVLILSKIKIAQDGHHAKTVGFPYNTFQPGHIVRSRLPRFKRRIYPGLAGSVPDYSLQIEGKSQEAVLPPAFMLPQIRGFVPGPSWTVRILPVMTGLRIGIIENALDHPAIGKKAFKPHALVVFGLQGDFTIDIKIFSFNGHPGLGFEFLGQHGIIKSQGKNYPAQEYFKHHNLIRYPENIAFIFVFCFSNRSSNE